MLWGDSLVQNVSTNSSIFKPQMWRKNLGSFELRKLVNNLKIISRIEAANCCVVLFVWFCLLVLELCQRLWMMSMSCTYIGSWWDNGIYSMSHIWRIEGVFLLERLEYKHHKIQGAPCKPQSMLYSKIKKNKEAEWYKIQKLLLLVWLKTSDK